MAAKKTVGGQCRLAVEGRGESVSTLVGHRGVRRGGGGQQGPARARTDRRHGGGSRMCTEGLSPDRALPS